MAVETDGYPIAGSSLENIDVGFYEFIDEVLNLHVTTNKGFEKVPILWNAAERAFQIKNNVTLRDSSGKLRLPIMSIERSSVTKDPSFKGSYQANNLLPSTGPRGYKNNSYLVGRRIVGVKSSEFMENDPTSQEFVKKLTEIVSSAKGTVGESIGKMPDITTDEGAKEFNKIATDLYNNLTENLSETLDTVESLAVGRAKSDSNNAKRQAAKDKKAQVKKSLTAFTAGLVAFESGASKMDDKDAREATVDQLVKHITAAKFERIGITTKKEAIALLSGYPIISKSVNIANAVADVFPEVESKNPEPESEVDVEQDVEQDLDDDSTIEYYTGSEHSTSEVEYKYIDQADLAQMYINKYGMTCAFKLKSK